MCCGGGTQDHVVTSRPAGPPTEADREARARAAAAAQARQNQFAGTAVGRAALTADKRAKQPVTNSRPDTTVADWQS